MALNPQVQRLDQTFPWEREVVQASLRRLMTVLENRISPLEAKVIDWQAAVDQLTALGLGRINDALAPAIASITALAELGFMTAPSTYSVLLVGGTDKIWVIDEGPQRDNFKPTPFIYIQHNNSIDDWAVARLLDYNSTTGALLVHIEYVSAAADPGPHTDWTLSMSPAATPAIYDALTGAAVIRDETVEAHDDVVTRQADVATKQGIASAAAIAAAASSSAAAASAIAAALFDPSSYYTKTAADARYYTQTATDTLLAAKAAASHTHTASQVTDFNTAAAAAAFSIGDVLATARTLSGSWLPLDGAIKTTATYTALQALLGNTYAQFAASSLPTMPAGLFYGVVWESAFNLYLAGGTNGTTGALASSPDGVTWTSRDTTASRKWSVLASNGVKAMAINAAANTANCILSSNGTTWAAVTSVNFADLPLDNYQGGLLWLPGANLWVSFSSGTSAPEIKTSANDGTSWTARTSAFAAGPDIPGAAAVGNGIIVQLAASLTGVWQTSTDGVTWTRRTGGGWSSVAGTQATIKFLNGLFIIGCVFGNNRASIYISADGITWTLRQTLAPFGAYMSPISYLAPLYVFEIIQFVGGVSYALDTVVTADFINWRRGMYNIAYSAGAYKSAVNATAGVILFSAVGSAALSPGFVHRTTFDFNAATQFHVPYDENIFPPRWIKAL